MQSFSTESTISYLSELQKKSFVIYWSVLLIIIIAVIALPFITIDISVKSAGILRPVDEKTELKSSISTVIDSIFFKEGESVKRGEKIIQLRKENIGIKKAMNDFEIARRTQYINDLLYLTKQSEFNNSTIKKLQSPVYKQQYSYFMLQLSELNAQAKKIQNDMRIDEALSKNKMVAPKDVFDRKIEYERLSANIQASKEQQIAKWQQELAQYQLEKNQYESANQQLQEDDNFYSIKAPIDGVLQNFNKYYQGSLVQAGEVLAIISPQAELIAECYVNTRDVGLLKLNQTALFQIDAFDYNYFGIVTGRIFSIDNDYIIIENKPMFKVRCSVDKKQLHLKNGFTGNLKKGMTLQSRFVVTNRTLWQLLFDKIDDWVNPIAPQKITE